MIIAEVSLGLVTAKDSRKLPVGKKKDICWALSYGYFTQGCRYHFSPEGQNHDSSYSISNWPFLPFLFSTPVTVEEAWYQMEA